MKVQLRDYQADAFQRVRDHVRMGCRRILVVAPTGSGKTVLASAIMEMTQAKGNRAAFVVDRLSLINQTSAMFDKYGLDHGVIQGDHFRWAPQAAIQVCSVQTLMKREWPDANVDVFDEAHILHKVHKARMASDESIVVGLTATPFTKGLGKYFDAVVNVTTTRKLIHDGWLSEYRIFSCVEPDMSGVKVRSTGEWDESQASGRALEVVGDVVAEYLKHGEGRKFICSGVDTAHVEELHRQFIAAGINTATYTYRDKAEDREESTREFRKPGSWIRGLITVTAASRGFDVPDVSCIIMARPLRKSLAEHIQLFGRGLRVCDGKTDLKILDHSGNCVRFYDACETFFDEGVGELDDGVKKEKPEKEKPKKEPMKCPACGVLHVPLPSCPACGFTYPRRDAIRHVPGTLKELIAGGHRSELTRQVWPMVCAYARERREGDAARKQALAIFRSMTNAWPTAEFYQTPSVDPTPEIRNRIRASQIRHAHSRVGKPPTT